MGMAAASFGSRVLSWALVNVDPWRRPSNGFGSPLRCVPFFAVPPFHRIGILGSKVVRIRHGDTAIHFVVLVVFGDHGGVLRKLGSVAGDRTKSLALFIAEAPDSNREHSQGQHHDDRLCDRYPQKPRYPGIAHGIVHSFFVQPIPVLASKEIVEPVQEDRKIAGCVHQGFPRFGYRIDGCEFAAGVSERCAGFCHQPGGLPQCPGKLPSGPQKACGFGRDRLAGGALPDVPHGHVVRKRGQQRKTPEPPVRVRVRAGFGGPVRGIGPRPLPRRQEFQDQSVRPVLAEIREGRGPNQKHEAGNQAQHHQGHVKRKDDPNLLPPPTVVVVVFASRRQNRQHQERTKQAHEDVASTQDRDDPFVGSGNFVLEKGRSVRQPIQVRSDISQPVQDRPPRSKTRSVVTLDFCFVPGCRWLFYLLRRLLLVVLLPSRCVVVPEGRDVS
mmetsp:Transcript_10866/g.23018  ORF Transcript_10866/g.23018 Transcript_10866/m.23018 type:complete len:442 (+) Transcript_10866:1403-2728(+)